MVDEDTSDIDENDDVPSPEENFQDYIDNDENLKPHKKHKPVLIASMSILIFLIMVGAFYYFIDIPEKVTKPAIESPPQPEEIDKRDLNIPAVKMCQALVTNDVSLCIESEKISKGNDSTGCDSLFHITQAVINEDLSACSTFKSGSKESQFCNFFISRDTSLCNNLENDIKNICVAISNHDSSEEAKSAVLKVGDIELLEFYYFILGIYNENVSFCNKISGNDYL